MACCKCCCGNKICENGEEGKCCCQGDNSITCCQQGEYCCNGVCQEVPCGCCCLDNQPDPTKTTQAECEDAGGIWKPDVSCEEVLCFCEPCEECSFPADRLEFVDPSPGPCGAFPISISSRKGQSFGIGLPPGVSWKPGYPDAIEGCNWRWMTDYSFKECYGTGCLSNGEISGSGERCCAIEKYKFTLLVIDCDNQSFVDITDQASEFGPVGFPYQEVGPFEVMWDKCLPNNNPAFACENLTCTGYPGYFDQPDPVCAP